MKFKFYRCRHCGNLIGVIKDSGISIFCCGERMEELVPNTVEASTEKHIPVVNIDGNTLNVKVGDVMHPMQEDHYIEWIYVQFENGGRRIALKPGDVPEINICIKDCKVLRVFAYCNLHGLWMKEI